MPTVGQYLSRVWAAASPGQRHSYATPWRRAGERLGGVRLDRVYATDIMALQQMAIASAAGRGAPRGGRYAGEMSVRALRVVFRMAEADGWIRHENNPAARVRLARRLPSTRRGLTGQEIAEINQVVACSGRDAALDCLLVRLHLETACRRGGALGLCLGDLDTHWCQVRLREKGGTERWQPVSPTLARALAAHACGRGATGRSDALLRRVDGQAMSPRHYDALWARVRRALPWAGAQGISAHWLRHTTITWVERRYGYAVARAYAGHTDTASAPTATFARAKVGEIATALVALTGEPHPLAAPQGPSQGGGRRQDTSAALAPVPAEPAVAHEPRPRR